jgi:ATP:ADP antiporter, AAA family
MGTTPLFITVIVGAAQNIFSKSCKYAFFDPTKEMAYIPLDQESKVKGKAAIDVVGARFGKSGGSLIQQGLLLLPLGGTIASVAPFVAVILFFIIGIWIVSARSLNKLFVERTEKAEAPVVAPAKAKPALDVTT